MQGVLKGQHVMLVKWESFRAFLSWPLRWENILTGDVLLYMMYEHASFHSLTLSVPSCKVTKWVWSRCNIIHVHQHWFVFRRCLVEILAGMSILAEVLLDFFCPSRPVNAGKECRISSWPLPHHFQIIYYCSIWCHVIRNSKWHLLNEP
jgi:hypothetical protein